MAVKVPRTMPEFLGVSGVGEVKAEKYGEAFLKAIPCIKRNNSADLYFHAKTSGHFKRNVRLPFACQRVKEFVRSI